MPGVTVKDVPADKFVGSLAEHFKKTGKVKVPMWSDVAKTGTHKELSPYSNDWYFIRMASIARHIYLRKGVGVGGLKKAYCGSRRNGVRPSHSSLGSGSIARHAVHALEQLNILEKSTEGGRQISKTGRRDLDRIACGLKA